MNINNSIKCNIGNYNVGRAKSIEYIVIHYTGVANDVASGNAKYFNSNGNLEASAHYFVDETSIYQSVSDTDTAWHCGANAYYHPYCRNSNSIGIEMCCKKKSTKTNNAADTDWYFAEATISNTVELVKMLMKKYNMPIENVIRHYDVTGKICPAPYVHNIIVTWSDFKNRLKEEDEMVVKKDIEMFGVIRNVEVIEKDGYNFIKLQELNKAAELAVTYDSVKKLPKISLDKRYC